MKAPQQERSAAKVQALLAAARTILHEHPETPLTTRSVALAAHVPVSSLYRYFADIDDLLDVVVREHAEAARDAVDAALATAPATIEGTYLAVLDAHLELYERRPELTRIWRSKQLADRQAEVEADSDAALARLVAAHLVGLGLVEVGAGGARVALDRRTEAHWNAAGVLLGAALHAPETERPALLDDLRTTVTILAAQLERRP